jgi:hypothetical protein
MSRVFVLFRASSCILAPLHPLGARHVLRVCFQPASFSLTAETSYATIMSLGIQRLNARRKQPNDRINFIKPLEGPDKALSEDFLERIAAIVNPIMKKNHLAVMSLEEYEANPEFLGRNFNAGEVIQLVLKTASGKWMPFKFVQKVMIHELSHCKQMNHSKAFWKVRNDYSAELEELWQKGYNGEGMWSREFSIFSNSASTLAYLSRAQSIC